ncbi:Carboxypeptidase Y [Fusarium oxysporum f. sp. albedinis]|nr:Carboxypeptidase Y [Fusarium oxysporum f. sp. albedinis]
MRSVLARTTVWRIPVMSGRGVDFGTKSTLLPRNPLAVGHVVVDGSEPNVSGSRCGSQRKHGVQELDFSSGYRIPQHSNGPHAWCNIGRFRHHQHLI